MNPLLDRCLFGVGYAGLVGVVIVLAVAVDHLLTVLNEVNR
jgi:hypothetical protein